MSKTIGLFRSFWQAGFECSTHKLQSGKRLDEIAMTAHDRFVTQDYERLAEFGISTVREGLRWHLIQKDICEPSFDFSSVLPILRAAEKQNIQVIWDLLHFGWPDNADVFSVAWLNSFAGLAREFGKLLQQSSDEAVFVAPVNEISFLSWGGGDCACLNPYEIGRGPELKRQLVRAYLAAANELRIQCPRVTLVAPEPVIHIVGDPAIPGDVESAETYRLGMFEAWDMIAGRAQPELGGSEAHLDILGINYYARNQWRNFGPTIDYREADYRPFRLILAEVYQRYQRPLFVAETGTEDDARPGWLAYVAAEVRAAKRLGVPMEGICLYPILNHPGWSDDRHCRNGLWDYAAEDGSRPIYQPLADELKRQQHLEREYDLAYTPRINHEHAGSRPPLPLPSQVELCLPAPPASDGALRTGAEGLLLGGASV